MSEMPTTVDGSVLWYFMRRHHHQPIRDRLRIDPHTSSRSLRVSADYSISRRPTWP